MSLKVFLVATFRRPTELMEVLYIWRPTELMEVLYPGFCIVW